MMGREYDEKTAVMRILREARAVHVILRSYREVHSVNISEQQDEGFGR